MVAPGLPCCDLQPWVLQSNTTGSKSEPNLMRHFVLQGKTSKAPHSSTIADCPWAWLRGTVHGFHMQISPNQHFFLLAFKDEHKQDMSKCTCSVVLELSVSCKEQASPGHTWPRAGQPTAASSMDAGSRQGQKHVLVLEKSLCVRDQDFFSFTHTLFKSSG